jgi:uncharacterized protein
MTERSVDRERRRKEADGQFLLLGSASLDLLKQSSESLAGHLATIELTPLLAEEVSAVGQSVDTLWVRGGFPDSYLVSSQSSERRVSEEQAFENTK